MDRVKILHIASFNGNIGDNANHNGLKKKLTKFLPNAEYKNLEMREFYQSWGMRNFNSQEFIDECNYHDLVIVGGGNFFELKWDYSATGTTINITKESLEEIKTPIFFNALGCDIAKGVSSNNINKFDEFLSYLVSKEDVLISVRNDGSLDTLKRLYKEKYTDDIFEIPDWAFFIDTENHTIDGFENSFSKIGINIVSDMQEVRFSNKFENSISYEEYLTEMALFINQYLDENKNYQFILFPHIYSDLTAISDLLTKINDIYRRNNILVAPCLTGNDSEKHIFGLYNQCEVILGMRFHSNVCAIAQNIPTIGLSSYQKISDLYKELNLSNRCISVTEKNFSVTLKKLIVDIRSKREVYLKENIEVNKVILSENEKFESTLTEWLRKQNLIS